MEKIHQLGEKQVSLILLIGAALWDAYAQAKGIPYQAPVWLIGVLTWPYGGEVWSILKDSVAKLHEATKPEIKKID